MTRTNRLPGGDDKHNDRTRQLHHRASPTPRAGANITASGRAWTPLTISGSHLPCQGLDHHSVAPRWCLQEEKRRRSAVTTQSGDLGLSPGTRKGGRGGDCEAAFKKGNDAGAPPASWPQRTAKGFPPIHPPRGSTIARSAPRANGEAPGASHARRRSAAHAARSGAPRICISHPPKGADALHQWPPPPRQAQPRGAEHHRAHLAAARHRPRHRRPPPRHHALGQRNAAAR